MKYKQSLDVFLPKKKMWETQKNNQISRNFLLFWKVILFNISIWLFSIDNAKACIICLTAIVKMCSISCLTLQTFIFEFLKARAYFFIWMQISSSCMVSSILTELLFYIEFLKVNGIDSFIIIISLFIVDGFI